MKIYSIIFPLWQLLPTLLLLSAITFTDGSSQRSPSKKPSKGREFYHELDPPSNIRKKRQLFDGFNFQFMDVLTRAMDGVETMLRSTQNMDVFNCMQRISCEITAPLNDDDTGRQLRRNFLIEDVDETEASLDAIPTESSPTEKAASPTNSLSDDHSLPMQHHLGQFPLHPFPLPYYSPFIYGVHPFHLATPLNAANMNNFTNYAAPSGVVNPIITQPYGYPIPVSHFNSHILYTLPSVPLPYPSPLIGTATPSSPEKHSVTPQQNSNSKRDERDIQSTVEVNKAEPQPVPANKVQSNPTLVDPRNVVRNPIEVTGTTYRKENTAIRDQNANNYHYKSENKYNKPLTGRAKENLGYSVTHQNHQNRQNHGNSVTYQNRQNHGKGVTYQNHRNHANVATYQNHDRGAIYQNRGNEATYQNHGNWDNIQDRGSGSHTSDPIQRIGYESEEEEEESPSWFSGYRSFVKKLKNKMRTKRRNDEEDDRSWFRRLFGNRRKRSLTDVPPTVEEFKSRVKRGIMDTLSKYADNGKEFMGALERMMQGASGSSIYPLTQAALMGYMGTPETCEKQYPMCPTSSDEMINTFNNLRRYFPNGIPFRDRIPRPLRFFIP